MSKDQLDSLLKPLIKRAKKLEPEPDKSAELASCESKFGGMPYAEAGDAWPRCAACNLELTFINQIYDEDKQQLFVFYYCCACFPWGYSDEDDGEWLAKLYKAPANEKIVTIRRHEEDEYALNPCKTTFSFMQRLPDWEGLDYTSREASELCCKISDDPWQEYAEAVERLGCISDYATILGGYPRYVQSAASFKCPTCDTDMEFYAQIDSEDDANIMWGDMGLVYFFRCPQHENEFKLELQCH